MGDRAPEHGAALLVALTALALLSGLGLALVASASSETLIAGNFRSAAETAYAADALAGRVLVDLRTASDVTAVLTGAARSSFVDGAPAGTRVLPDGVRLDLASIVNLANCGRTSTCSAAAMDAVTGERPWGRNNPRWSLYAYGVLGAMAPATRSAPRAYVVAMVADDPSETDGNPLQDAAEGHPGSGVLALRVEAFGARGAHHVTEITLVCRPWLRVLSWRP